MNIKKSISMSVLIAHSLLATSVDAVNPNTLKSQCDLLSMLSKTCQNKGTIQSDLEALHQNCQDLSEFSLTDTSISRLASAQKQLRSAWIEGTIIDRNIQEAKSFQDLVEVIIQETNHITRMPAYRSECEDSSGFASGNMVWFWAPVGAVSIGFVYIVITILNRVDTIVSHTLDISREMLNDSRQFSKSFLDQSRQSGRLSRDGSRPSSAGINSLGLRGGSRPPSQGYGSDSSYSGSFLRGLQGHGGSHIAGGGQHMLAPPTRWLLQTPVRHQGSRLRQPMTSSPIGRFGGLLIPRTQRSIDELAAELEFSDDLFSPLGEAAEALPAPAMLDPLSPPHGDAAAALPAQAEESQSSSPHEDAVPALPVAALPAQAAAALLSPPSSMESQEDEADSTHTPTPPATAIASATPVTAIRLHKPKGSAASQSAHGHSPAKKRRQDGERQANAASAQAESAHEDDEEESVSSTAKRNREEKRKESQRGTKRKSQGRAEEGDEEDSESKRSREDHSTESAEDSPESAEDSPLMSHVTMRRRGKDTRGKLASKPFE